jgi:Ni/Co efflux regulator RcnB
MTRKTIAILVAALAALSLAAAPAPAKHGDKGSKLEGRVLSVDRSPRTIRIKDAERGTATVAVTSSTKFDGIRFSAIRAGKRIQVLYKVSGGRKVATKIEPSAGANHS